VPAALSPRHANKDGLESGADPQTGKPEESKEAGPPMDQLKNPVNQIYDAQVPDIKDKEKEVE